MKTLKERRLEFLEEGIAFYSVDPIGRRSVEDGVCRYRNPLGNKCFIGRHIPDEYYSTQIENYPLSEVTLLLPKEVRDLGIEFLRMCQGLHDYKGNWDNQGLTTKGQVEVTEIKKYIEINE